MDILYALLTAALFGLVTTLIRVALRRVPDAETGALATTLFSFLVCAVGAAIAVGAGGHGLDSGSWRYLVLGAVVPGISQIFFVRSVALAGPSRTGIVLALSPILAAFLAIWLRDESFGWGLGAATGLIVAGAAVIATEGARPEGFRALGILYGTGASALYAVQGILLEWSGDGSRSSPVVGSALFTLAAAGVMAGYLAATRGRRALANLPDALGAFLPVGLTYGLGYVTIGLAYASGRVVVVAPLIATLSLFTVASAVVLVGRRADAIGPRVVAATVIVVSGGVLVGVFR